MSDSPPKIRPLDADESPKTRSESPKVETPKPPPRARRGDAKQLRDNLERFYATVGGGVATAGVLRGDVGLVASGTNIGTKAAETADAWLELADTNPRIKRFLEAFMEGSAIANLVAAHLSMIVPIVASQGLVPEQVGVMFLSDEAKQTANQFAAAQAAAAAATNGGAN